MENDRFKIRVKRPGASWTADSFRYAESAIETVKRSLLQWDPTTEVSVVDVKTGETIFSGMGSW